MGGTIAARADKVGLFLSKKNDLKEKFKVPEKLLSFEERMNKKE